jgi:hypothetical protein
MQPDLSFYKHIVQIDFNARHYVEGNLWASMVEHILENLHVTDDQRLTITEEMQQRWIIKVGFTERSREEVDKKNTEATARVSQQTLSRKSAARDFKLSDAVQVITDSLEPLGFKPLSDAVADLQSSLREAKRAVEGGNAVFSPLIYAKDKKDQWRSLLLIVLAAPFVGAAIGWILNGPGHAQVAQISAWATGATGLLTGGARWLRKQAEWVSEQSKKVENAQRTYDEALAKELASPADQIAKTEQELALARQDSGVIQFDGLSPFRPCGRDLVEFFKSTVWAFYVKLIGDEGTRCAAYRRLFARRLPKAGTFKQATRRPRARDKQIGSDCDARTSVSRRVVFGTVA